jgi:hypothetical protein
MSDWVVITESDLLTRVSGAELSSLRAAALADGQADPVAQTIEIVTNEILGYLPRSVTPSAANTIPSRLLSAALDRVAWLLMSRPGAMIIDTNDARKDANTAAIKLFESVASGGGFKVTSSAGTGVAHAAPKRTTKREDLKGL